MYTLESTKRETCKEGCSFPFSFITMGYHSFFSSFSLREERGIDTVPSKQLGDVNREERRKGGEGRGGDAYLLPSPCALSPCPSP